MNILFAVDVSIKKVLGGAERVLYEETTRLAKRGHDVYIITRMLPYHSNDYEVIEGVKEYRYRVNQRNPLAFLFSTILNSRRKFLSLIRETSLDAINYHQPFTAFGISLTKENRRVKKVYTCLSLSFEEYKSRHPEPEHPLALMKHKISSRGMKYIERRSIDRSEKVIVLSEFTKDRLISRYGVDPRSVVIIPGGVDLYRFHPTEDRTKVRKDLSIPLTNFILFTVRNLVPRMGLENLIISMKKVSREARDVYLMVGGEGALKQRLESLILKKGLERSVNLVGFIPEDRLPAYYQMADLFILPTQCLEGFGLVTLEALACGTPVLGTYVGGTVEILSKFNESFLMKGTDPETIANSILWHYRYLKNRPDRLAFISKKCRRYVEENYSWEAHINSLEKVFSES